jgi:RimJ/RimL family protein N-acetyltransferase
MSDPDPSPDGVVLSDGEITLRPPVDDDVPAIAEACADPEIPRWTTVPCDYREHHAAEFVDLCRLAWREGLAAPFVVVDAGDPMRLLGAIEVRHTGPVAGEVGYWVAPWARRRGVASSALGLLCDWAFGSLGAHVLTMQIYDGNDASMAVAQRVGFHRAGEVVAEQRGEERPAVLFSRISSMGEREESQAGG